MVGLVRKPVGVALGCQPVLEVAHLFEKLGVQLGGISFTFGVTSLLQDIQMSAVAKDSFQLACQLHQFLSL